MCSWHLRAEREEEGEGGREEEGEGGREEGGSEEGGKRREEGGSEEGGREERLLAVRPDTARDIMHMS